MHKFIVTLFLTIILNLLRAEADTWEELHARGLIEGKNYQISSGTGFFVSQNYFITNAHVMQNCINISVRGSIAPSAANLVAIDTKHDLALLYTGSQAKRIAYFRSNDGMAVNDILYIIGYPLKHADTGDYVTAAARLISIDDQQVGRATRLEFTAAIEHGNSGGPLIDSFGNVVGVIQGKKNYYHLAANNSEIPEGETPFQVNGLAIGLGFVQNFLFENHVYYLTAPSFQVAANFNPLVIAQDFIVNVHCVHE